MSNINMSNSSTQNAHLKKHSNSLIYSHYEKVEARNEKAYAEFKRVPDYSTGGKQK